MSNKLLVIYFYLFIHKQMRAKVDKNENIGIDNQLDNIIEYQGYEEFHI